MKFQHSFRCTISVQYTIHTYINTTTTNQFDVTICQGMNITFELIQFISRLNFYKFCILRLNFITIAFIVHYRINYSMAQTTLKHFGRAPSAYLQNNSILKIFLRFRHSNLVNIHAQNKYQFGMCFMEHLKEIRANASKKQPQEK